MTVVKICGLTNLDDALCAVDAGADILGFIFYPKSPRFVTAAHVREMVREVRSRTGRVVTAGVFVNADAPTILQTLDETGLDVAQLSGDEGPETLEVLGGRAYKAVRTTTNLRTYLELAAGGRQHTLPELLLDGDHPTLYGGSGVRADEALATQVARQCRLLLAGGLNAENVGAAIRVARPWGVDVASGVEASPGRKDHAKVRSFVQAARAVTASERGKQD